MRDRKPVNEGQEVESCSGLRTESHTFTSVLSNFELVFETERKRRRLSLQRRFPNRLWFEQLKQQVDPVKIGGPCWSCRYRNSRIDESPAETHPSAGFFCFSN
jgi:hypothetical protein